MEYTFEVKNMHCEKCALLITDLVSEIKGVNNIIIEKNNLNVSTDLTESTIKKMISEQLSEHNYTLA